MKKYKARRAIKAAIPPTRRILMLISTGRIITVVTNIQVRITPINNVICSDSVRMFINKTLRKYLTGGRAIAQ
jgi:hypothetical protein